MPVLHLHNRRTSQSADRLARCAQRSRSRRAEDGADRMARDHLDLHRLAGKRIRHIKGPSGVSAMPSPRWPRREIVWCSVMPRGHDLRQIVPRGQPMESPDQQRGVDDDAYRESDPLPGAEPRAGTPTTSARTPTSQKPNAANKTDTKCHSSHATNSPQWSAPRRPRRSSRPQSSSVDATARSASRRLHSPRNQARKYVPHEQ